MKSILINKHRRMIALLSLIAVAALAVGITIAWFSDTEELTNVAQVKSADITLSEVVTDPTAVTGESPNDGYVPGDPISPTNPEYTVPLVDGSGNPVTVPGPDNTSLPVISPLLPGIPTYDGDTQTGASYPIAMPGASYVKAPFVTNDSQPVFLRLVVTRSWTGMTGGDIAKIILHTLNAGTAGDSWTYAFEDGKDVFYYNQVLGTGVTTSYPFDYFTIAYDIDNSYLGALAQVVVTAQALQAAGLSTTYPMAKDIPADLWSQVEPVPEATSTGSTGGSGGSSGGELEP